MHPVIESAIQDDENQPSKRKSTRPLPMNFRALEMPYVCDICGIKRSTGSHKRCSRIRQERNAWKWTDDSKR